MLDLVPLDVLTPEALANLELVTWFSGGGMRDAVNHGQADVMPCYYRDMPALFTGHVEIDAFFAAVSPMDEHGWFSTGASASNAAALLAKAKRVYLEVKPNMPRSIAGPAVHISQVTAFCEHEAPLPIRPPAELDEVSRTIGGYIAEEVCDGATIQLGIGTIPAAVGLALRDKHDLGIHTELLSDSMVELVECGAVTNARKPVNTGKTVATLAFGSQRVKASVAIAHPSSWEDLLRQARLQNIMI